MTREKYLNRLDYFDGQYNCDFTQGKLLTYAHKIFNFKENVIIRRDEWCSANLRKTCYRLFSLSEAAKNKLEDIFAGKDMVAVRTNTGNIRFLEILSSAGFKIVNAKLYLRKKLSGAEKYFYPVRSLKKKQCFLKDLRPLLKGAFVTSRFYKDDKIAPAAAERLYEKWLDTHAGKKTTEIFSIFEGSKCAAFLAASYLAPFPEEKFNAGFVDLITVLPEYRNRGYALALLRHFEDKLIRQGTRILFANTAIDNYQAQILFSRNGLLPFNSVVEMHWWNR